MQKNKKRRKFGTDMRICIFTDVFLPYVSGVVTTILNQTAELAVRGHNIIIIKDSKDREKI